VAVAHWSGAPRRSECGLGSQVVIIGGAHTGHEAHRLRETLRLQGFPVTVVCWRAWRGLEVATHLLERPLGLEVRVVLALFQLIDWLG
jgi:hypothetical protein